MPSPKIKTDLGTKYNSETDCKYHRCEKLDYSESLRKDIFLWGGAAALVFIAHAAGAYIFANMQSAGEVDGVQPAAIMIEFAELAVSPDAENVASVVQAETAPEKDIETDAQTNAESDIGAEQVKPEPETEPDTEPETVSEALSETKTVEELPEEKEVQEIIADNPQVAIPLPMKRPEIEKKPEQVAEPPKKTTPQPKRETKQTKPKKAPAKPVVKDRQVQASAAPAQAAESGKKFTAKRNGAAAGTPGMSSAKWSAKLQAHLERQKRFVERRSGVRGRGVAQLSFVIDPVGNVLSARIAGSTGNNQLDQMALDLVKRASPVPAPPPAIAKPRLPIVVPIYFK